VNDYLGEPSTSLRLKGVKSAPSLASDSLTRSPNPNGQALGSRYDFSASLSTTIHTANSGLAGGSGLNMKSSTKKHSAKVLPDASYTTSPLSMASSQNVNKAVVSSNKNVPFNFAAALGASGSDLALTAGTEKPVQVSQLYNELLEKYCFVRIHEF
jgi:hypothetical protein